MLFYLSLCLCWAFCWGGIGQGQESRTEQRLCLYTVVRICSHNSQAQFLKDLVENTVQTCWLHCLRLLMRRKVFRFSLRFTQEGLEGVVSSADTQHSSQGILVDCSGPGTTGVPTLCRERL